MSFSQQYVAVVVSVLSAILPKMGVVIGSVELTNFVSVVLTIGAGLWALYRRWKVGDINVAGMRK